MGIILMDGFEKNSYDQWPLSSGASIASSSGLDMSGSYVVDLTGSTEYIKRNLGTSYSELFFQFRFRSTEGGTNLGVIQFYDSAGTTIACVVINLTTRVLEARLRNLTGTLLGSSSTAIALNTTYLIKIQYKPLNSGGIFKVYIDRVEEISFTGDTTYGLENVQTITLGGIPSTYGRCYIDDIIISTADITKNLRIAGKAISGAGTTAEWDPSAGANYECVDEVPPVHTDYNSTNVSSEIDTFALGNCIEAIDNIEAVQVELSCAYEGSPTPAHLQAVLRINGTNYFSSNMNPPSSFGEPAVAIWETNPDDSAPFEEADINAMEIGYKATA